MRLLPRTVEDNDRHEVGLRYRTSRSHGGGGRALRGYQVRLTEGPCGGDWDGAAYLSRVVVIAKRASVYAPAG